MHARLLLLLAILPFGLAACASGGASTAPRSGETTGSAWKTPGPPATVGVPPAKNVILLLADGAGYNTFAATALYRGGPEFPGDPGWIRVAASAHALRQTRAPFGPDSVAVDPLAQDPSLVYDPRRAWDPAPVEGGARHYPYFFRGYRWLRRAPDSANTATALATGWKTHVGAINTDGAERPIDRTIARIAHESGRRVGVVSSVPFSHATPAAFGGAHSPNRGAYREIALEMLTSGLLDLIAGCGHPDFDNNGEPIANPDPESYRFVGGRDVWAALAHAPSPAAADSGAPSAAELAALRKWSLVQRRESIEALVEGETPDKLLIVPEIGEKVLFTGRMPVSQHARMGQTLQQERGSRFDPCYTAPGDDPATPNVPSLATVTRVALNALDDDPDGFFLHVEGGAVDWAMHGNQMGRMIEEMLDFERAVRAVTDWVEARDAWDHTLVIVTADHDHMLWGPASHERPFQPLQDRGAGEIPAYRWLSDHHSAALVPVFAKGAGSEELLRLATNDDPVRGPYLDQTDVFRVMAGALESGPAAAAHPESRTSSRLDRQ